MLHASTVEAIEAAAVCENLRSRLRNSFRCWLVPPTAPIDHMLPSASR